MQKMKFSKLSLLSQKERRALQTEFAPHSTVVVAGNGFGKSAILKSLYETLGSGQHYQNQIADQFELVADKDELLLAYQTGKMQLRVVSERISAHRSNINRVEAARSKLQGVLAIKRDDITLRDVVAAEGRTEAQRYLQERLGILDAEYKDKQRVVEESERQMKEVDSKSRKITIKSFFTERLQTFADELDVRLPDPSELNVQGLNIGRGSEGPRARAAYYFAFLHTAAKYGSSTFCPI